MSLANSFIKSKKLEGSGLFSKILEKEKPMWDTGIYALNLAYSGSLFGGTREGLSSIAGKSKSFKTLFGLISAKAYLDANPGSYMIFYDSEGGASQDYFEQVGIDPSRVIYIPIMNVEELKFDLVTKFEEIKKERDAAKKAKTIDEIDKFVIFVDSIGNLASIKEVRDALSDNPAADMGTRAKALKGFFRLATPYLARCEMHMIAIQHTYDEMASMGAPKQIMSGGCLLPGTKIIMADESLRNIEDVKEGELVLTKNGNCEVYHTWGPDTLEEGEPECYEIEFEDGYIVKCSDKHKFLIDNEWVMAKDLVEGQNVYKL